MTLPVSATYVDQNAMIQGLPHNVPFQPNVNVGPQAGQLVYPCTGHFLYVLHNEAQKNPLRIFLFNYLSRNYFNNPDFNEVLSGVIEYAEVLMNTQRMSLEQAAMAAAGDMARMMASIYARKFPELVNLAGIPQTDVDIQVNEFQRVRTLIDNYYQQQQGGWGQPQQGWSQTPPQQQGWNQPQQGWNQPQPQQPWQQPGGYQQPQAWNQPPQQPAFQPYGVGRQHPSALHSSRHSQMTMNQGRQQGPDMFNMGTNQPQAGMGNQREFRSSLKPTSPVTQRMDTEGKYHDYSQQNQPHQPMGSGYGTRQQQVPQSAPSYEPPVSHYQNEDDLLDTTGPQGEYDHLMTDNYEAKPVAKADWKFRPSLETPYRMAYDPSKQVKFMVKDRQEKVTEMVEEMKEDMEYLNHELDSSLRSNLPKEDGKTVVPNWGMVAKGTSVETAVKEMADDDLPKQEATLVVDGVFTAYTNDHAKALKNDVLKKKGIAVQQEKPVEYIVNQITPFIFDEIDDELVKTSIYALGQFDKVNDLVIRLADLSEIKAYPKDLLNYLVGYCTATVNRTLSLGMGLNWSIESILEDWKDLPNAFIKEYGTEQGILLFNKFNDSVAKAINIASTALKDGALEKFLADPNVCHEKIKDSFEDGIMFSEISSVTEVPWRSDDISLILENGKGAVLESKLPELHNAISGIVARTKNVAKGKGIDVQRRFIETKDGVRLEITEGLLGKDYLILSLVS